MKPRGKTNTCDREISSWNLHYLSIRLDIFCLNVLQESIHKTDVLVLFRNGHSHVLFALDMINKGKRGKGL